MNAFKLNRRRATGNSIRFVISAAILTTALLTTSLAIPALERVERGSIAAAHGSWIKDVRSYLRNPIDYFSQRSPGARGSGPLIQSKHSMFKLARHGVKPHEQVLSNIRYGAPVPPYVNDLVPAGPRLVDFSAPLPNITNGVSGAPGPSTPVVPVSVPNSGPGGAAAGTAVPEASTWLMLIWGMALVGFGLRAPHRRRLARTGFRAQI